ncbi:MAG: polysaccharide biosynthesis tyrosine autokinase [Prevotella sp.]|nr:polysaccharide biosynthesis tyrosine autokinase [Prevotella sp.]
MENQNIQGECFVNDQTEQEAKPFSIRDYLKKCLTLWPWFIVSIIVFASLAAFWALRQQPLYLRTMAIMVKNQNAGNSATSDLTNAFSSMGIVTSGSDVDNELFAFQSPALMEKVVKTLRLNYNYETPGKFHPITLYGTGLPIDVELPDMPEDEYGSFVVKLRPDGTCVLSDFEKKVDKKMVKYPKTFTMKTGFEAHRSPLGRVIVRPNGKYAGHITDEIEIKVTHNTISSASTSYYKKLTGEQPNKYADVIELKFEDVNIERANAVLNTILEIYNEDWVEDKNRVAVATSRFIQDRLAVIEKELANVDNDISSYKETNVVSDVEAIANAYIDKSVTTDEQLLQLNNRLAMAKYVSDYLGNPNYVNSVIPANTGIGDLNIENLITKYNTILMDRNNYAGRSSENNPLVQDYDTMLKGLRESIVRAVNSQIVSLSTSIRNTETSLSDAKSRIANAPEQARYLISAERQQKVKEALYMFLLQKLSENELTQAFTAYNTRLITPPSGSDTPVSPKTMSIIAIGFFIGILIPGAYVYLLQTMDTKVRTKADLEKVQLPYCGEIPLYTEEKRSWIMRLLHIHPKEKNMEKIPVVVKNGNRSIINEAFRVVRNNVEFITEKKGDSGRVFILTSFNPGSGKSFVSCNLAVSFSLKHKRVLIIDGDMRHASASTIVGSPKKGLSTYLNGDSATWHSHVVELTGHKDVDVLPVGVIPPNPAELLESPRLESLIEQARQEYDYVFIDCPPLNIVSDTMVLTRLADRSIFIVRSGLFHKDQLRELAVLGERKSVGQLCMILNGTTDETTSYYGHSYYGGYSYYNNYFSE